MCRESGKWAAWTVCVPARWHSSRKQETAHSGNLLHGSSRALEQNEIPWPTVPKHDKRCGWQTTSWAGLRPGLVLRGSRTPCLNKRGQAGLLLFTAEADMLKLSCKKVWCKCLGRWLPKDVYFYHWACHPEKRGQIWRTFFMSFLFFLKQDLSFLCLSPNSQWWQLQKSHPVMRLWVTLQVFFSS